MKYVITDGVNIYGEKNMTKPELKEAQRQLKNLVGNKIWIAKPAELLSVDALELYFANPTNRRTVAAAADYFDLPIAVVFSLVEENPEIFSYDHFCGGTSIKCVRYNK